MPHHTRAEHRERDPVHITLRVRMGLGRQRDRTHRHRACSDNRTFAGELSYQIDELKSVQGIDRHQADLFEDYSLFDEREEGRVWLRSRYDVTRDLGLELEAAVEMRDRSGRVRTTERSEHERRYVAAMQFVF